MRKDRYYAAELRHAHVARELGISVETLDEYPYQFHANVSADGMAYSWRVEWDDTYPPGVDAHGIAGSLSSDIAIPPEDEVTNA